MRHFPFYIKAHAPFLAAKRFRQSTELRHRSGPGSPPVNSKPANTGRPGLSCFAPAAPRLASRLWSAYFAGRTPAEKSNSALTLPGRLL
jgi:hypothetical protein